MNTAHASSTVSRMKLDRLMETARDERARYLAGAGSRFSACFRRPLLPWAAMGAMACLWLVASL